MKNFYIHTLGCKINQYESQLIADKFEKDGFTRVYNPTLAQTIIINSCTVTHEADKECDYLIRKFSKIKSVKQIIATGCYVKNATNNLKEKFKSIKIIENKSDLYIDSINQTILQFENKSRAFLKIQDGCNSFCSYCIVPFVRNNLWSKPVKTVLYEIENLIFKGFSEIVLSGIHVGKYENGLSNLLKEIIKIKKEFRIRISSIELNEIDDTLINIIKDNPDKICNHLHIPLQSGSTHVLKEMNRTYTAADYEKKVISYLNQIPALALTTDIITGFPKEEDLHHKQMCDFILNIPFARFHIFRYSDRQGTKASQMYPKVLPQTIKKRWNELFEIDQKKRKEFLKNNIGKIRNVVSIGSNKALTDNYITINNVEKQQGIFKAKITKNSEV